MQPYFFHRKLSRFKAEITLLKINIRYGVPRFLRKVWSLIRKLWTPIFVDEGSIVPKWYGLSEFIPYPYHNPPRNEYTFVWQKIAYPYSALLFIVAYHWTRQKLKRGFLLPPELYRTKVFQVRNECPHCHKNVYDTPVPHVL